MIVMLASACGSPKAAYRLDEGPPTASSTIATATTTSATASEPSTTGRTSTTVRAAAPWTPAVSNLVGQASECGNLSYVSARPDRDAVIVGVARQGLFVGNGTAEWQPLGTAKESATLDNRTSSIVYDPASPETFWQSGIYGPGVFRTTNDGRTFVRLGDVAHVDMLSVDLTDPARATLLAGIHESNALFRSSDGGRTWADITLALGGTDVGFASSVRVVDSQTFLVGTLEGAKSGVYRSADAGKTFLRVWQGPVVGQMVVSSIDGSYYWLLRGGAGVIKSADRGETWRLVGGQGRLAPDANSLVELSDGRLASWGQRIVVSADGAVTWTAGGNPLPFAPAGMTYSAKLNTFFVWKFDCHRDASNAVPADAIMKMDGSWL